MPRTKEVSKAAAARLNQLLTAETALAPDKYHAVAPEIGPYNVFGPQYAGALAADTGTPAANILNTRALGVNAEDERRAYAAALAAANENERYLQVAGARIKANQTVGEHDLDTGINQSVGTARVLSDPNGLPYIQVDPAAAAVQTSENLNEQVAGRVQKIGAGVKDLGAAGYLLDPKEVAGYITPAGQEAPAVVQENFTPVKLDNGQVVNMLPDEVNDYINALANGRKADAAMIAAKAAQYRAEHPTTNQAKTVVQFGLDGKPIVTTVTTPGADPPEYSPDPKAGASGSAPATTNPPAFFNRLRTVPGGEPGAARDGGARTHHGRDYSGLTVGTAIPAPSDAELIEAGTQGNGGNYGKWRLKDGRILSIAHLQSVPSVKKVRAGEALALAGNSGNASTRGTDRAVLHVRAWDRNSKEFDPQHMFAEQHAKTEPPRRPVQGGDNRIAALAQAKGYPHQVTAEGVAVTFPTGRVILYANDGSKRRLK